MRVSVRFVTGKVIVRIVVGVVNVRGLSDQWLWLVVGVAAATTTTTTITTTTTMGGVVGCVMGMW